MSCKKGVHIVVELGDQFGTIPLLCLSASSFPRYSLDKETEHLMDLVHGGTHGHWSNRQAVEKLRGIQKTEGEKADLFRPGWERRIQRKIESCKFCLFMKQGATDHGESYSTVSEQPGTHWACDTKQMYEDDYGFKHMLVTVDMYSRMVYLRALKTVGGDEACRVIRELIEECGSPALRSIRHDAGTQFVDSKVQRMLAEFNIASVITVPGNKRQNGMAERAIQTCRIQLAALQWDSGNLNWSDELKNTEKVMNESIRLSSGVSPAEVHNSDILAQSVSTKEREDEVWKEQEGDWILALRTDKMKLDIMPRVWDGPFKVIARNNQLVDIQDIAGNRSLIPISNTKAYRPEENEDIECTELLMYNATNEGEPFYIVDRVIDHQPVHNCKLANLKLKVLYKGYGDAEWYKAKNNRDILKTAAFAEYAEGHNELAGLRV